MKAKEQVDLDTYLLDEFLEEVDKDFLEKNRKGFLYSDEFWKRYKEWFESHNMRFQILNNITNRL